MGEGQYVAQGIIVGHENARFFGQHGACAKTAGPLAGSWFPVDPAFVDHLLSEEVADGRIGADKRLSDSGFSLVPRKLRLIRQIQRGAEIKPGNAALSHLFRLCPENTAGKLDVGKKCLKHGIEGFSTYGGLKESDIEKVLDAAMAIKCQTRSADGVERSCCYVFHRLPCGVPALERCLSDAAVRMIHQRATLGYGETLTSVVGIDHVELKLRRNCVVEPSPGLNPVHGQIRCQNFFLSNHYPARLFSHPVEIVLCAG